MNSSLPETLPDTATPAGSPAPGNPAPVVIPALRHWTGDAGHFEVAAATRIVVDPSNVSFGHAFAADLAETIGLDLAVVIESPAANAGRDIRFILDPANHVEAGGERYKREGYTLTVTASGVVITAPTPTGLFYGSRTVLQILAQTAFRNRMPSGTAVDWPDHEARGFILDVGRRFFTAEFIKDYIKLMSFYKLNRFQIHLNDNQIFTDNKDWTDAYAGFRLASTNPAFNGLASTDGSYSRADWDAFEDFAAARGVTLIPEIDGPAHAAAIIHWRPEVGHDNGKSDHLDLQNPASTQLMKEIFSEFTPWFRSPEVNFGADEYPRHLGADFRQYYNDIAAHIRSLGKTPSAWGSFSYMGEDGIAGYDKDVVINSWNNDWYGLEAAAADGMKFINTNDDTLYVVPFADYYHGSGLDNGALYADWLPHQAAGQEVRPEQIMGAMFAVWNDLVDKDYSELDVHLLIEGTFPVVAQKTWAARSPSLPYPAFAEAAGAIGMGPGLTVISTPA
jgi:hypothetical protein